MKLKYLPALLLFIVGIGCLIAHSIIGAKIGSDGILIEPFFLLPVGYLLAALGIIIGLTVGIVSFSRKTKKSFK
ncbi:DUF3955 domain-containing protein [Paenibacillus azoreducens]|uniref:DUF3955 domain-containing protein n=1 Tax=Paenibacillus azoreducens TaxID=116718 RepID=A0A920CQ56_9BACL|nr:DUF3955 domain-containing protein [Paenibacillus azoreducens]GIO46975.1 hypothetical protein J34TS1_17400 [Paenibacillus azoreducens]